MFVSLLNLCFLFLCEKRIGKKEKVGENRLRRLTCNCVCRRMSFLVVNVGNDKAALQRIAAAALFGQILKSWDCTAGILRLF